MGTYGEFGALNTKIKVLKRSFLKDQDYIRMMDANTVDEAIAYIQSHTAYGNAVSEQGEDRVSIRQLEEILRVETFKKYEKLVHYLTDKYRDFFRVVFMRFEVENLKLIFRALNRKEPVEPLIAGFYRSDVFPQLDYGKFTQVRTVEDAVKQLLGTPYYRVLIPYVTERPERILFYLEMNLDRTYFNKMAQAINDLPKGERRLVSELLGKNADILNIQWIYRGRKYYGISSEELFNYCLASGHYLNLSGLKQLCYALDADDLVARLRKSSYAFLFSEAQNIDRFMELGMERYLFSTLTALGKKGRMTILPAVIYIHRVEYEMRDIFSLLEAKKFGMGADETKQFLVRVIA